MEKPEESMTTARELHDEWPLMNANERAFLSHEDCKTILRALDLQGGVEESEDKLVRELRRAIDISGGPTGGGAGHYLNKMAVKAIAALVALKAERDSLKAHAEAMAMTLENLREERPGCIASLDDYRRDFPKDTP